MPQTAEKQHCPLFAKDIVVEQLEISIVRLRLKVNDSGRGRYE
jgi:hypothetical protein